MDLGHLERQLFWPVFVICALAVAWWEMSSPRATPSASQNRRWLTHVSYLFLGSFLANFVYHSAGSVMVALWASNNPFGVLSHASIPYPVRFLVAVVLLDFAPFLHHYCCHTSALLWRVHQMHHTDPDYDFSTGLRFHPLEAVTSKGFLLGFVILLAPPPEAVIVSALLTLAHGFFSHANAVTPLWLRSLLRQWLITPDIHRLHHSQDQVLQNRNLGTLFPWWDRLFGTYQEPAPGDPMTFPVGLRECSPADGVSVVRMLLLPFRPFRQVPATVALPPSHS
jgi:sterol desaturase/sphingolipid hydroxylase (fatty acid hydroxylase superfamily)